MKKIAMSAMVAAMTMTMPSCSLFSDDNKAEYYEEAYEIDDAIDPNEEGAYEKYLEEVAKIEEEEAHAQEAAATSEVEEVEPNNEVASREYPDDNMSNTESESAMQERELELRERELALKEREQALNDREQSISQREQAAQSSTQSSQKTQSAQSSQKSNTSQSSTADNKNTQKTETKSSGTLSSTEIYNILDKMAYNNNALKILVNDRYENRKAISQISASMNQMIAKLNNCSTMTSDQKSRFKQLSKEFNNLVK